jgi:hypothetical protein
MRKKNIPDDFFYHDSDPAQRGQGPTATFDPKKGISGESAWQNVSARAQQVKHKTLIIDCDSRNEDVLCDQLLGMTNYL